jgi:hypothetical protein
MPMNPSGWTLLLTQWAPVADSQNRIKGDKMSGQKGTQTINPLMTLTKMARALELTLALSLLSQLVASIRVPRDDSSAVCSEIAGTISSIDGVPFAGATQRLI